MSPAWASMRPATKTTAVGTGRGAVWAGKFTLFKIDPSRGSSVLREVLGETFGGVLGCDYFSAYRKYMADAGATVQFCMAHLIRDVRFLADHPAPSLLPENL